MKATEAQVAAGQAVYTRPTLAVYDVVVLGVSNRFIWRCPTARIEAHYRRHASANHLDVGVGTGYFLDRCPFPSRSPRIALMDLNPGTLEFAARRIARYAPETYRHNVLEPFRRNVPRFDSVAVNYLLHCLPGAVADKAVVFDHLEPLMNPGATLFGSTILSEGVPRNRAARRLMRLYNARGIFSNAADDLAGLTRALRARFDNVAVEVIGCVALFSGRSAAS